MLQALPNCLGSLVNLTQLSLGYCHRLQELPEGIGLLHDLQVGGRGCRT
jgi:hypothetical protein